MDWLITVMFDDGEIVRDTICASTVLDALDLWYKEDWEALLDTHKVIIEPLRRVI